MGQDLNHNTLEQHPYYYKLSAGLDISHLKKHRNSVFGPSDQSFPPEAFSLWPCDQQQTSVKL